MPLTIATSTGISSVGFVARDLISDRNIIVKIIYSILCTFQLITAWAVTLTFLDRFIRERFEMEFIVTIVVLIVGNYLITGIANAIIYLLRWRRSALTQRRKEVQQNKEAWIILRLVLTLLGLSPLGRYIECIQTSIKLKSLEKQLLGEAVNQGQMRLGSLGGSIFSSEMDGGANTLISENAVKNLKSGKPTKMQDLKAKTANSVMSHTDTVNTKKSMPLSEKAYRKVHKARREMRRCEHDAAQLALISGFAASAPMIACQFFLMIRSDVSQQYLYGGMAASVVCVISSVLWSSAALIHYYPAKRMILESEFERGTGVNKIGLIILFFARLLHILPRSLAIGAFSTIFLAWILLVIGIHYLCCFVIYVAFFFYDRADSTPIAADSISQKGGSSSMSSLGVVDFIFYSWVEIWDFANANGSRTRIRYLIYYFLVYFESLGLVLAWFINETKSRSWYRMPLLLMVIIAPLVGFVFLQVYLYFFHEDKGLVSICGFFTSNSDNNYRIANDQNQPRDALFGTPLSQSAVPYRGNKSMNGSVNSINKEARLPSQPPPPPMSFAKSELPFKSGFDHSQGFDDDEDSLYMESVSQAGDYPAVNRPLRGSKPSALNNRQPPDSYAPNQARNQPNSGASRPYYANTNPTKPQRPQVDPSDTPHGLHVRSVPAPRNMAPRSDSDSDVGDNVFIPKKIGARPQERANPSTSKNRGGDLMI